MIHRFDISPEGVATGGPAQARTAIQSALQVFIRREDPEHGMIRPYRPEDFEVVTRLWRRARQQAMPEMQARLPYSYEQDCAYFQNHILSDDQVWVCELDQRPVAFMALRQDFVDHLYVDPDFQRRGIGRSLIEHARRLAGKHLWLYTHQANTIARAFYDKNGFFVRKFGVSPAPESEPDVEYHWQRPDPE